MAGGANGGAGTEGKAFNAGPVGVNLADPQGTEEGLDQAREAQNAFNAALEAELEASPFSSLQEMAEFEQSLFDTDTMMAQAPVPGTQYNAIDFIEQFGPLTATTHNQTPWRGLSTEDAAYARAMQLGGMSPTPPGLGLAVLGAAIARGLTSDTPQGSPTNYGMGVGGGPDAANMSLDDFGINDALSQEESDVYNLDNAYAQLDLEPFYNYINPAVEAIKNSALAEAAKKIDAVPIPGIEVIQGLDIGKKVIDAIPDIMGVDFPSYGPSIPGKGGGVFSEPDGFEPSMNLQMELNPAIDSNLSGVEGFMEAGGVLGGGSGVIGPNFDARAISEAGGEALQEALAQRAVENILSQQAPRQMINVTPPAPPKVAPQRRAAPKPSPIQVAAKAITRPEAVKELPKFAQESLRQGKVPTGLNSRNQDLVDRVLATPKVDIMSAGVNVKGNRALQKARSRAAQDAK